MLHDLVAECVSKHPDEVCLVFDSGDGEAASQQRVTYSQMWQTAMELKQTFKSLSVKEQIVGVVLVDGIIVPSVLLGLLSSSCAFHPFNTGGLRYACNALRKAGASWILAHSELTQLLKPLLDQLEGIKVPSAGLSKHGLHLFRIAHNSALSIVPQLNIAYSITTSGTTSDPKVVLVPHACILPNIIDLRNIFQLSIGDRVLLTSPLTFDPSIIDIFCTLTSGACLVIVPTEVKRMPEKLLDIVHFRQAITAMQATPTLIRSFSPSQLRNTLFGPATALRVLALGGEPFPSRDSLVSWLHADNKTTQFYNLYGVTEVSCWASCQHVDVRAVIEREELVSIGETLHDTIIKLVVDDTVAETQCSDGEGDIWIGSQSRICLIGPEVCENIAKDRNSQWTEREQIVWRNTGDRGKLQQDGSILCLGRRDDQVKRHGKRLSLEALEMVCKEVTGVLDCTALLEETSLMVFIIPDSPTDYNLSEHPDNITAAPKTVGRLPEHPSRDESNFITSIHDTGWSLLQQRLTSHIEDSLPNHYMPTSFMKIAGSFPLTQNGKLDKKQLLKIRREQVKAEMDVENVWSLSQQVWKVNLPDPHAVIQETGNFISLGGDSLAAVKVMNQLEGLFSCSLPTLLDALVNKSFQHFVEELQRCLNLRLSDISVTQMPLPASKYTSNSLGNSNLTKDLHVDYNAGEKAVDGREQKIKSLGVYNKKLQAEKHKYELSDEWTRSKMAKLTHISTPLEATAMDSSLSVSVELHRDCKLLVETPSNASFSSQEKLESHKDQLESHKDQLENHKHQLESHKDQLENHKHQLESHKHHTAEGHGGSELLMETYDSDSSNIQGKLRSGKDHPELSCDVDVTAKRHRGLMLPLGTYNRSSSKHEKGVQSTQDNPELNTDTGVTTEGHSDLVLPLGTCLRSSSQHQDRQESPQEWPVLNSSTDTTTEKQVFSHSPIRLISRGSTRQKDRYLLNIEQSKMFTVDANTCAYNSSQDDTTESNTAGGPTNTLKTVLGLTFRWKFDTKKCVDASPLVVELRGETLAFIGSHSGQFSAVNILTGSCLWSVTLPDRIESSACCSLCGSYVVVGCYDGMLYVINARSGFITWKFQTGDTVKCSPVIDDHTGYVICGSHDGYLYCLDVHEELCVWKCHLGGGSVFSSPAIDTAARTVYAASLAGRVLGICSDSGTVRWIYNLKKPVFSSLCLLGHSMLIGCVDGNLYCLNSLGHVEWTFSTQASVFSTPVVHESSIILGSHDHHIYCLTQSGRQVWTFLASAPVYATAFASTLTRSTETYQNSCTDLSLKDSTLKQPLDHVLKQPYSIVVTADTKGVLYVLSYADGQVKAEVRLPSEIFSSPVVVDNLIVVGCRDNFVYCFEITSQLLKAD